MGDLYVKKGCINIYYAFQSKLRIKIRLNEEATHK